MGFQELLLMAVGIMNIALAFLVGQHSWKNPINRWFSIFAYSLALWTGSLILFRTLENTTLSLLFLKLSYVAAISIAESLYVFMHYFPEKQAFSGFKKIMLVLSTILALLIIALPKFLVTEVVMANGVKTGILEIWGFAVFSTYFICYFFGSLYFLYRRWHASSGPTKTHLGYIMWSVLIAGVFGAIFNLALPSPIFKAWSFTWLGPLFTAIIVVAISYAVTKYQLLNIKVIAAEMLSTGIVFVLFLEIIFAKNITESILRFIFFIITGIFSSYLVQSVKREVEQKEQLENLTTQLEQANQELKKLDQAKSEFISLASHQLLTPLTAIKGYSSMILEKSYGVLKEKMEKVMNIIFISSNQLVALVSDLLNVSRIESGKMHYDFEALRMRDMVKRVTEEVKAAADKKGLVIEYQEDIKNSDTISGDKEKIHEVVLNILDNAVKYSDTGTLVVRLANWDREGKLSIIFSVQDNGIGISPEEIGKLFTKFTRSDEAKKIRPDGMGLGLYFVKKVVDDHHGRVWVESGGLGKGSTFFVELPADLS